MNSNAPFFTPKVPSFEEDNQEIVIKYLENGYSTFFYRASKELQEDTTIQAAYIKAKIKEADKKYLGTFNKLEEEQQFKEILPEGFVLRKSTQELARKLIKCHAIEKLERRKQSYIDVNSVLDTQIHRLTQEISSLKLANAEKEKTEDSALTH